jgi:replicative DNA helicase
MGYEPNLDAHLYMKPDGFDLMKMPDRLLLENKIEEVKPDLLLLGPLYKSFIDPGGRTSEAIATEVAKYLDTLRAIYGVALWLEHHAPLGTGTTRDLRPFGSAVWSRWPEFGLSLTPDPTNVGDYVYRVAHFRGARDERHWPLSMKRGVKFPFEVIDWMMT